MKAAAARACANVALAKYWGKRDARLNLPWTGSLSVTLAGLETAVRLVPGAAEDRLLFDGEAANARETERVARFLDLVRGPGGAAAQVEVASNFPVAAGLASSASMFAALACAASHAYGVERDPRSLSVLARRGSGSAARSIFGGFVEWRRGEAEDGSDSFAEPVATADHWPLGVVVAVTEEGPKKVGSREGMSRVVTESPFFDAWVDSHAADLEAIRRAVRERDLTLLGTTAEHNCLKMHATSIATRPALLYWGPGTVAVMREVMALRDEGTEAYFTIDAGPQVKILCAAESRTRVAERVGALGLVRRVLLSEPGPGVEPIEEAS